MYSAISFADELVTANATYTAICDMHMHEPVGAIDELGRRVALKVTHRYEIAQDVAASLLDKSGTRLSAADFSNKAAYLVGWEATFGFAACMVQSLLVVYYYDNRWLLATLVDAKQER